MPTWQKTTISKSALVLKGKMSLEKAEHETNWKFI